MGLYNFQPQFVPFIVDGRKQHTIRDVRDNADKPGNTCHNYTGLRHPGARLLGRWPCMRVEPISIRGLYHKGLLAGGQIYVAGAELSRHESERLAMQDGFPDLRTMLQFWITPRMRLPFDGHIIHWKFLNGKAYIDYLVQIGYRR